MKSAIHFAVVALIVVSGIPSVAFAVPVSGLFIDDPRCDNPGNMQLSHELGDLAVGFPIDEALIITMTPTTTVICVGDDGVANDWDIRITNASGVTYENLFFVADAGILVGNADGFVVDTTQTPPLPGDAFRIDGTVTVTGGNDNLLSESGVVNERFEPGETWQFLLSNFGVLAPPMFTSIGTFAGTSTIPGELSNASILATVVPEPSALLLATCGLIGLVSVRRRRRAG